MSGAYTMTTGPNDAVVRGNQGAGRSWKKPGQTTTAGQQSPSQGGTTDSPASQLSQQNAGQDLVQGEQSGAYSTLNNIIGQGYIDASQRDAAMGRLQGVLDGVGGARDAASGYMESGGYDAGDWSALMGGHNDVYGKSAAVADRGGLTTDEYNRILTSGRADMMNQGRANAEAFFNAPGGGGSMGAFAANAAMAGTQANTGREMVSQRADLDMYQSDTRAKGRGEMLDALQSAGGFMGDKAGNRGQGMNALNDILGIETGLAGDMAGLETATMPGYAGGILDNVSGSIDGLVDVKSKTNKKGKRKSTQVTTAYGTNKNKKGGND